MLMINLGSKAEVSLSEFLIHMYGKAWFELSSTSCPMWTMWHFYNSPLKGFSTGSSEQYRSFPFLSLCLSLRDWWEDVAHCMRSVQCTSVLFFPVFLLPPPSYSPTEEKSKAEIKDRSLSEYEILGHSCVDWGLAVAPFWMLLQVIMRKILKSSILSIMTDSRN